ncbi:hypothetical protein PsorP6_010429 [Peronosclerospora sorghi]|uniref:Uncharacterized protein n=1 Tax=Peronosclerospora sorghi TaxID=230839 RepID=A0ACC0VW91_9STRA|nr:hypothetical protein PsorP6_010429 [Peronosclerospora sorghi]
MYRTMGLKTKRLVNVKNSFGFSFPDKKSNPKKLAISRKYSLSQLVREILLLALAWGFCKTDAAQLAKETISYGNGDPPFHNISASTKAPTD